MIIINIKNLNYNIINFLPRFENIKVQRLYDTVYSKEVADMRTTSDIYHALHNLIEAILSDEDALAVASEWGAFRSVLDHQRTGIPTFKLMDFNVSRVFELWMWIYH